MGNLLRVPRKDVLPSVKGTLNHSFSNYIGLRIAREGISAARVHEIACNLPRSSDPSWEELADVPDNFNYSRSHAGELPDPGLMTEDPSREPSAMEEMTSVEIEEEMVIVSSEEEPAEEESAEESSEEEPAEESSEEESMEEEPAEEEPVDQSSEEETN